jgi:nucleotide-binding universal stress UspA family protein
MRTSLVRLAGPLAVLVALLSTLTTTAAEEKSRLDVVLERGKLIVAALSPTPPFAFTDEKGQLVGFDIDIAHPLAEALFKDPNKIEFVVVTGEGRWPAIEDVIRSLLSEKIMMVVVTHALAFARAISHRIAYVSDGRIAEVGRPGDVLDAPSDATLKDFLRRMR